MYYNRGKRKTRGIQESKIIITDRGCCKTDSHRERYVSIGINLLPFKLLFRFDSWKCRGIPPPWRACPTVSTFNAAQPQLEVTRFVAATT